MDRFEELNRSRKLAHTRFTRLQSKVYQAFSELEKAAFTDGALARKHKELIAVGISVVTDCESCMQWHIEQAARAGATLDEVLEAVEVAIEMGVGPATVSARFALDVMDQAYPEEMKVRTR